MTRLPLRPLSSSLVGCEWAQLRGLSDVDCILLLFVTAASKPGEVNNKPSLASRLEMELRWAPLAGRHLALADQQLQLTRSQSSRGRHCSCARRAPRPRCRPRANLYGADGRPLRRSANSSRPLGARRAGARHERPAEPSWGRPISLSN